MSLRCRFGFHDKVNTYQRCLMDSGNPSPAGITRGFACKRDGCEWIEPDHRYIWMNRVGPVWYWTAHDRVFLPWSIARALDAGEWTEGRLPPSASEAVVTAYKALHDAETAEARTVASRNLSRAIQNLRVTLDHAV